MLTRILAYVIGRPWAVTPEVATVIADVLTRRSAGEGRLSAEELQPVLAAAVRSREPADAAEGAVAVLPISGLIAHRARMVQGVSSQASTSSELLAAQIRQLAADPRIAVIVLDIDSPGGSVEGIPELAAEIRRARAQKPITAVANALAASAAYWIAAQATELVVTPSAQVGSIGVYSLHEDHTAALERQGVKISMLRAPAFKAEGAPFEPLSDDARASLQAKVDAFYGMFVADVAKGRGVPAATVRADFGQGRTVLAKDAVAAGMADRVATLETVLHELAAGKLPEGRARQAALTDEALAAVIDEVHVHASREVVDALAPANDLEWRQRRAAMLKRRAG